MENRCYDADCLQTSCFNPKHYNYICFDPNCDEIKCTNSNHYNKQLLKDLRKNMDLDAYEHEHEHDDCCSHDHAHEHSHGHEHEHEQIVGILHEPLEETAGIEYGQGYHVKYHKYSVQN